MMQVLYDAQVGLGPLGSSELSALASGVMQLQAHTTIVGSEEHLYDRSAFSLYRLGLFDLEEMK